MNKDQIKGRVKALRGNLREEAGKASDDLSTRVKGMGEKAAGTVQKTYGDVKEDIKGGIERLKDKKR